MDREDVDNIEELVAFSEPKIELNKDRNWTHCHRLNINFDFYHDALEGLTQDYRTKTSIKHQENFKHAIPKPELKFATMNFRFVNCYFNKEFKHTDDLSGYFEFDNCHFNGSFDWNNITLKGKIKFWNCSFNSTNFNNTTFSDLVDFYNCTFKKKVFFYKTDFKATTVFSASTFTENVLFTYALIEKLIIFRGTKFGTLKNPRGLDLSLAIIKGEINPFDIRLNQFYSIIIDASDEKEFEKKYDECITPYKGELSSKIPIKNKRETYRILKEAFVSRDDISASIKYKVLEKETIREELNNDAALSNLFERINLWFNWVSNRHSSSYFQAIKFTTGVGFFLFFASIISAFCPIACLTPNSNQINFMLSNFIIFIDPFHDFNYFVGIEAKDLNAWFYIWDFLGRIFVGFGIYQFIQAFRKYR